MESSSPVRGRALLGRAMSGMCSRMNRKKRMNDEDLASTPLNRCLTTFDITLLGVGHMVGAGIYVLTGTVARNMAGPGVTISFLIAGMVSLLAAICYAEFGARVPKAGSAYAYTYTVLGEFWAFIIGWNIILEHTIGAASVARAWSGYVDSLTNGFLTNLTHGGVVQSLNPEENSFSIDPFAAGLCALYTLIMACGVQASTALNSILTVINLCVMILVIGLGFKYADLENWSSENGGFLPFGMNGVLAGAATCFYAFIGFDSVATAGEEAKNPEKSIPLAIGISMAIVTTGYILVAGVLTLIVPFWSISSSAALPEAFASKGIYWAKYAISVGALCGMTTTLFGSLFSLPRITYAMASDGLLFESLGRVESRSQIPVMNLALGGIFSALVALFFDLEHLVEFMSIGTFLAYTIVSASVMILRYRPERIFPPVIVTPTSCSHSGLGESPLTEGADTTSMNSDQFLDTYEGTGRLKRNFIWLSRLIGTWEPGSAVVMAVVVFSLGCIGLSCLDHIAGLPEWCNYTLRTTFLLILLASLLIIQAHQQVPPTGKFRAPLVPIIPAMSVYANIMLMSRLSLITWLRFVIWFFIGMFVYFLYGIRHSKEAGNSYLILMASAEAEKIAQQGKGNDERLSDKAALFGSQSFR